MKMKLCRVLDHQNKSQRYRDALSKAGWTFVERKHVQGVQFILTDSDWRQSIMDEARGRGIPVFLYPHAARPMVPYDGCVEPQPVRAMFTHSEGGAEIMRIIGYPNPVEVTGWSYSDIKPFQPRKELKKILFAPIHPNQNGWLSDVDKDLNWRTLERLVKYCHDHSVQLSVRYIGEPKDSGIDLITGSSYIEMHQGKKNNSSMDMETADLVVGHQTFAYIAVALGIPTIMMGEEIPPRSGNTDAGFCYVKHWEAYKDLLQFPLDILQGETAEVIAWAMKGCPKVEAWKDRIIGKPFDGSAFVEKLESYL
ncbi:MAG: hypothetical protein II969_15480 [Anaerolineaceae bacterium]|nr:hypothetical protein [Anaerolineaceae bacterium]